VVGEGVVGEGVVGEISSRPVIVRGRRIVNDEPWPSVETTAIVPRWLSTTWRTIDRPRPVPPVARLLASSTR
jgi:hypothetical protein